MAKVVKEIGPADDYLTTGISGGRSLQRFTRDRFGRIIKTFDAMKSAGHLIPTPWTHGDYSKAKPIEGTPHRENPREDGNNNAGYVERLFIQDDAKKPGGCALYAEMDIPLAEDESKIGTTCREVSPVILEKYVDGKGVEWKDAMVQLALVTNPIVPGQENFRPVENGYAIAMSHSVGFLMGATLDGQNPGLSRTTVPGNPVNATNPSMPDVLEALAKAGMKLPQDTTPENLMERIVVAGTALEDDTDDDSIQAGERTANPPVGVALSHPVSTMTQVPAPASNNPFACMAAEMKSKDLQGRIDSLCGKTDPTKARISKAYADEKLYPRLEGFAMSLDVSGNITKSSLEELIEALEAVPDASASSASTRNTNQRLTANDFLMSHERLSEQQSEEDPILTAARKQGERSRNQALALKGMAPPV
jgi:hypothetical protein